MGVRHIDYLFLTYQKTNVTPHHISELDIQRIMINPNNIDNKIFLDILYIY